jgi:hypothetical protein
MIIVLTLGISTPFSMTVVAKSKSKLPSAKASTLASAVPEKTKKR